MAILNKWVYVVVDICRGGGILSLVGFICVLNKFIIIVKCYLLRVNKINLII